MPRDVRLYLGDILQAIQDIEQYTATAKDFDEFSSGAMRIHAILYNLEIIGEAVKNVPAAMKKKYPNIESTAKTQSHREHREKARQKYKISKEIALILPNSQKISENSVRSVAQNPFCSSQY